jgi:hypothetical protein
MPTILSKVAPRTIVLIALWLALHFEPLGILDSEQSTEDRYQVPESSGFVEYSEKATIFGQFAEIFSEVRIDPVGGVYAPGAFGFPIVEQPPGKDNYVSRKSGLVTRFRQAERYGVTGLLAHNYLAGKSFYDLDVGQEIWLLFGDDLLLYRVESIHRYQRIRNRRSGDEFIDLNDGQILTTHEIFVQFYRGEPHVTFQTCLEREGELDWGLYFVVAMPLIQRTDP